MAKRIYYIFNPDTDNYERAYPSFRELALRWLKIGGASCLLAAIMFLVAFYGCSSPTEKALRKENSELRSQYNLLNSRMGTALDVMADLQDRDDNLYRVILQMEPVNSALRLAGLNNEERYRTFQGMSDARLLTEVNRNMDLLERQIYVQSQSFDKIRAEAAVSREKLSHIPSVMPMDPNQAIIAAGFGTRKDASGASSFHPGWDLAGKAGSPVMATGDGKVTKAEWVDTKEYVVEIDHGYNYVTVYEHLGSLEVTPGNNIDRGQRIGTIGNPGKAASAFLHYEVRFKNQPQDPVNHCFNDISPIEYQQLREISGNASHIME